MTRLFGDKGKMQPVTIIESQPAIITAIKTEEKDGYTAVQLGYDLVNERKLAKPQREELAKAKIEARPRHRQEIRLTDLPEGLAVGQTIAVDVFQDGDEVEITAISKGKGFAGTIKRHGFHRGPKTHGSHSYRRPGSIGSMFPQRVVKGKKMPGQMGCEQINIKGLKIVAVDKDKNLLVVSGSIPGPNKNWVLINESD
ncbi:MAG: large subunit ribosomal protein L3 [Candidatus Berkelbacteria bacterium Licking1014_2]|uniref:50S ribosomal protein L3 n=1 Tax=Candidatus Berkelbacteria bacterium Licking1014_2 TaxID=2017146 RepID=A0A554LWW1_9BACT|nr:MAG: large subunit ribosomal protein L3 [Candidatus Berkelbacteria bacterium Licking1014_2]